MRLGNDIVDRAATAEHNPRFIDRILSSEEKSRCSQWSLNEPLLWIYWACKEAAYKAIRQSREIPFHHREFVVASDFTTIFYHDEILQLIIHQQDEAILALATDGDPQLCKSQIFAFEQEPHSTIHSEKAREILLDLAQTTLQLPRETLVIRTSQRVPHLLHQDRILPHPVSLTHHGRYVAASLGILVSSARP